MDSSELKLLITIAQMYYEQGLTQQEISKKLSIYRTTISRLLKKAHDYGVVSVSINYALNQTSLLEKKIQNQFNLDHVIVVQGDTKDSNEDKLKSMGKACVNYMKQIICDGDVIGFSWGTSLAAVSEQLDESTYKDVLCVPIVGGPSGKIESRYHVNTIVYTIASKLHGKSLLMDFPAILEDQSLRDAIIKSKHYQQISSYWDSLSTAVFGIGSCEVSDKSIWHEFYGWGNEIYPVEQMNIAGDICSRFYDDSGNTVQTMISDTTININSDQLKRVKHRIGIAHSIEKVTSIIAAMKGGYVNTLITTKETAEAILERTSPHNEL